MLDDPCNRGKAPCATCGSDELLRSDGRVRTHRQKRVNTGGVYRSREHCLGSGELPEPVEVPV